jgi:hypothetical protein
MEPATTPLPGIWQQQQQQQQAAAGSSSRSACILITSQIRLLIEANAQAAVVCFSDQMEQSVPSKLHDAVLWLPASAA